MVTDWVLVRRLGHELEGRLRGARLADAGMLPDGRVALALRARGGAIVRLAVDAFASPPLVTLEDGELGIAVEPGFVRTMAAALRGTTLTAVRARRGDRLLRLTFSSRSRFGVGDELELYLELVPRFGNLVLVKHDTVLTAAKEFSLADNGRRAVAAGIAYALPPLPPESALLPKIVAETGIDRDAFLTIAQSDDALREPLYVYRRDGIVLQAHVVPLSGFADAECTREPALLGILAELRAQHVGRGERERAERRRHAVVKRLALRERKLRAELASLSDRRRRAADRDGLRVEGNRIFETLHERPAGERDDAKERAVKLFAQYKKLGAAIPHIDRRERDLRMLLEAVDALHWEAQRIGVDDLDDLEAVVAAMDARGSLPGRPAPVRKRKRALLEFRTAGGSRIVVGRSPSENADVTFKLARPNDLWFHAQGIPGAHVILARDDRSEPSAQDIEAAAALAAYYSKAKASAKVTIDYTLRKHVRKQRNAPPGLVWYTNPKSVTTEPRDGLAGGRSETSTV
ncbi:MAG: NFACT RNA binding domain-containing protein [Candidatus Tumulicola sp.]